MIESYEKYYVFRKFRALANVCKFKSPTIICACGFEPRSYKILELIDSENVEGDVSLLVADLTGEASPGDPYSQKAAPMIKQNRERFRALAETKGFKCEFLPTKFYDESAEYAGHTEICERIQQIKFSPNSDDVILDISSMPRAMMFPVFSQVYKSCPNSQNLFVTFTEIAIGSKESQVISYWKPQWLPGFAPKTQLGEAKISIWLPILGFDYRRVEEILRAFKFDEIFPIVGFPSLRPLETDSIVRAHKVLFDVYKVPFRSIIYAPMQDPFQLAIQMNRLVHDAVPRSDGTQVVISPFGSKPQSLGACLMALHNDNVALLAVWPKSYDPQAARSTDSYVYWIKGKIYE
jgi:hypothetical protein